MPKTIGGTTLTPRNIDVKPRKTGGELESLTAIPNKRIRDEVQEGISRVEAVYGIRTQEVKVGSGGGAYGYTIVAGPDEGLIVLDKRLHSDPQELMRMKLKEYKSGFKVKTNAPFKHTIIHELGHQTWNSFKANRGGKWEAAQSEIRKLYREYRQDIRKGRKPFSMYGTSNIDEFFAEAFTGSIIGTKGARRSRYINGIKKIIKKYKL